MKLNSTLRLMQMQARNFERKSDETDYFNFDLLPCNSHHEFRAGTAGAKAAWRSYLR